MVQEVHYFFGMGLVTRIATQLTNKIRAYDNLIRPTMHCIVGSQPPIVTNTRHFHF